MFGLWKNDGNAYKSKLIKKSDLPNTFRIYLKHNSHWKKDCNTPRYVFDFWKGATGDVYEEVKPKHNIYNINKFIDDMESALRRTQEAAYWCDVEGNTDNMYEIDMMCRSLLDSYFGGSQE